MRGLFLNIIKRNPIRNLLQMKRNYIALFVTIGLFIIMYLVGSVLYPGFFSLQVFSNLFIDNAHLCIAAIGITLVIISGGIDLSVGAVLAFTTVLSAHLLEKLHLSPFFVIPLVLIIGAAYGCFMGALIHFFELPPFIITLAGMYLARGMCYVISIDSITITNPFYKAVANFRIMLPGNSFISVNVLIFLLVVAVVIYLAHYTRFGRSIYAIGGNEQSAVLMGLPVAGTKILIYGFSGFCSALAGVVFTFYMLSGYNLHGNGLELEAIAAAVIGGTLLTGGVGFTLGTMFGVLILGTIQTLIIFQGTLSSWWTRIVIGFLIFIFCLLQKVFERKDKERVPN